MGAWGGGGAWSLQSCLAVSCTKRTDRIVLHAAAANTANNSSEQYPSALPVKSPLPCPPSTVLSDFPPTRSRFAVTLLGHPPPPSSIPPAIDEAASLTLTRQSVAAAAILGTSDSATKTPGLPITGCCTLGTSGWVQAPRLGYESRSLHHAFASLPCFFFCCKDRFFTSRCKSKMSLSFMPPLSFLLVKMN